MKTKIKFRKEYHHSNTVSVRWLAILYFHVFLCISSYSQRDSLTQYLNLAAKNNPAVLQKFYEYKAALQKVPQAGGLPDPEFSLGVFVQPMELLSGNEIADMRLMQTFPWFGTLRAAKDEMSLMAKAKFESFEDAKLGLFLEVKRTWNDLQRNQKEILTSEENLEILKTIEQLTLVRFKAAPANPQPMQENSMASPTGSSGLADLYRVQIERGELENNIALLKNQQITIRARFNSFLNRPPVSPVEIPASMIPDSLGLSLLTINDTLLALNPMLGMLHYEQQSLEARKKMVTRMSYPMLGLGVNYTVINKSDMSVSSMNGKDMIMPMVTFSLPIYRNKYISMRNEAEMLNSANKENYSSVLNSLQNEYYEAVQLFRDGSRRMLLYEKQSDLSLKTLDIMLKRYSASQTPLTDILRIRQQTLDYELKKIEAISDYNTAIAWIQRLMAKTPVQFN